MPSLITPGIVVRYANYRENDRILTLLTPGNGVLDVLARGCRRPKSPLMPACEWFVCGEYVLYQGNDRNILTSCALQDTFFPLRLDMYRLSCASYMAALCGSGTMPGQESSGVYALLMKGLYYLAYDSDSDALGTVNAFLLAFADLLGFRPRLSRCVHCRKVLDLSRMGLLDIEAGGLCCPECAPQQAERLTHEQVVWISQSLRKGFEPQKNTGDKTLFCILRRYVESRRENSWAPKAGKWLP